MAITKRVEAVDDAKDEIERPIEHHLRSPIPVYDGKVDVLKMRKPTGADLVKIGNPVVFYPYTDPPRVEHDIQKMTMMIAALADIPSSSVSRMEPADLIAAAWLLSPFFIPAAG